MQHQQEESVREVEQIRHMNDTIQQVQQESQSNTYRAQTEASDIRIVTPHYKTAEKPGSDLKLGTTAAELNAKFAETNGDYKAERSQEHFRMQIIDPKVNDNAYLPAHAPREFARKKLMEDFPSLHGKRSFLNLDALEQRRIRQTRPITTSTYLTQSVERHREAENSELKKYLKAREEDANKPWNKPGWPGPKKDDSHLRELEKLRESIDTLQKAAREVKSENGELDELSRLSKELAERSMSRRAEYKVESQSIIKTEPEPIPAQYKPPPQAIVRHEPVRREVVEVRREVATKPKVTQTVQRFEEQKRTEEVERRIVRRERRHKSHRTRYGHGYHQEYDWHSGGGGHRSTSASRGAYNGNGYLHPITYESHHTSSRRGDSSAASDRFRQERNGLAHARYGSLSDSLRRGELKYIPNGEVREANNNGYNVKHHRVHKSHSTRDVFGSGAGGGYYDSHYARHGGSHLDAPVVEFPPTLPRSHAGDPPVPPPHRNGVNGDYYRPVTKSRSYADWDQGRGPFGHAMSRYDDDMARLENEFRDSHLMRIPNGNMNEKVYRHEEIPGGYESYEREVKSSGGRKPLHRGGQSGEI